MLLNRSVSTQTLPNHIVERSSSISLTPEILKIGVATNSNPSFHILKVSCLQQVEYNVQLLPNMRELSEDDMNKMDVVLYDGKLRLNISSFIWRKFGFSTMLSVAEPSRQFNKGRPFGNLNKLTFVFNWVAIDILFCSIRVFLQPKAFSIMLDKQNFTHVASLRHELMRNSKETASFEICAIDTAFRSIMRNLLVERYPLIFSPDYQTKLETITQYVQNISNSLTRIICTSVNEDFQYKADQYLERIRKRVDLNFPIPHEENLVSSQQQTKIILADGLYAAAKNLKIPAILFQESSSEDEFQNCKFDDSESLKASPQNPKKAAQNLNPSPISFFYPEDIPGIQRFDDSTNELFDSNTTVDHDEEIFEMADKRGDLEYMDYINCFAGNNDSDLEHDKNFWEEMDEMDSHYKLGFGDERQFKADSNKHSGLIYEVQDITPSSCQTVPDKEDEDQWTNSDEFEAIFNHQDGQFNKTLIRQSPLYHGVVASERFGTHNLPKDASLETFTNEGQSFQSGFCPSMTEDDFFESIIPHFPFFILYLGKETSPSALPHLKTETPSQSGLQSGNKTQTTGIRRKENPENTKKCRFDYSKPPKLRSSSLILSGCQTKLYIFYDALSYYD
ncbi:hypothetical protein G9A89_003133 [Geosiphon pyriformis]|nr:hypothetical protein G9A89_003133 [Geosiphon pyriformis]